VTTTLLQVEGLKVHFPVAVRKGLRTRTVALKAVDGVSFSLGSGEALGVVGESGCGKSTLGRAVVQLVRRTEGRILWLGRDLSALSPDEMRPLRREVQIVFQDPLASHNPRMTARQIIGEPLGVLAPEMGAAQREAEVEAMMRAVGLNPELADRYPHELSGGQSQRVGIARAMILKPKLVVCDEPVSALDVSTQAQVINLIKRLKRDYGVAIIFISHDLSVVRQLCDRVMVMYLGHLVEIGPRDGIFDRPLHPYTRALLDAVPTPDPRRQRAKIRTAIKGEIPSPLDPPSGCVFRTRCPHATTVCIKAFPPLEDADEGQSVACHHWRELSAGVVPADAIEERV
jgi:oligopeptide transport system ATP-binding protein